MSGCGVGVVCSHLIVNRRIQRITKISVNYCKFQMMIIFDNSCSTSYFCVPLWWSLISKKIPAGFLG